MNLDFPKLVGIDRSVNPHRYLPKVVLTGEDKSNFLLALREIDQITDEQYFAWSRADLAIGYWNPENGSIPDDHDIMGHLCGRRWYAVYGPAPTTLLPAIAEAFGLQA